MAYDSTKPAGTDTIAASDDLIRANFAQVVANFTTEHVWDNSTAANCVHYSNVEIKTPSVFACTLETDLEIDLTGAFQPDFVVVLAVGTTINTSAWSIGFGYGTTEISIGQYHDGSNFGSTTHIYRCGPDDSNYQAAAIKSVDADGFTLDRVIAGTPTGTVTLYTLSVKLT